MSLPFLSLSAYCLLFSQTTPSPFLPTSIQLGKVHVLTPARLSTAWADVEGCKADEPVCMLKPVKLGQAFEEIKNKMRS